MQLALLDTDILSEVLKQRSASVTREARDYLAIHGRFAFSAFSRFEIVRGYMDKEATTQLTRFKLFCEHSLVLPIDDSILDQAARLWMLAGRNGRPRSDADLIIAATALTSGRVLVSGNLSHFAWIPDLPMLDWRAA